MVLSFVCALSGAAQEIQLVNPSFELPATGVAVRNWNRIEGWNSASAVDSGISNDEYYSPVHGQWYAYQGGGGEPIYQETDHVKKYYELARF